MTREPIPVTPAQHYFMGGIEVDLDSRTSFENLYAVGETSCNGVHGANRLASNSLLESLVFAERAARHIAAEPRRSMALGLPAFSMLSAPQVVPDYKSLILEEIKREDTHFYEQWCNN